MKKSKINTHLRLFLLSSVCSILIVNNLLILKHSVPVGYEIDIYSQLPSIFWLSLIAVYFFGSLIFFTNNSLFRKIGSIHLLSNYLIIFLVPYSLGYYNYGVDDELTHLGTINNIILTGRIASQNIYPFTHIFCSICSLIENTSPQILCLLIPSFFSLLFVIGILVFSRTFLSSETTKYFFPVSLIYYLGHFHFSIVPNYTYFTLIPILLFCITKYMLQKSASISAVLTLFLLTLPFTHPFIWLFISFVIFALFLGENLFHSKSKNTNILLLLNICCFGLWFISSSLVNLLKKNYLAFAAHAIEPVAMEGTDKLSKIDLDWFSFAKFMLFYTGRYSIPILILSIFIICLLFKKYDISKFSLQRIHLLTGMLLLFGIFQMIFLINDLVSHSPDRITNLNYMVFAVIPLFSISIYYLFQHYFAKNILRSVLLTSVFFLSVYGAFYSPYIYHANIASTYNEFDGMSWIFHYKGGSPIYDLVGSTGMRYSTLISPSQSANKLGKDILWASNGSVQDHFGYDQSSSYRERNQYIVVTTRTELLYQTVYKHIGRFNTNDFIKLNNDPQITKIYDSLNIKIYNS